MDSFLAYAGCKLILKTIVMIYPKELEDMTFKEVFKVMKKNLRSKKKLVIAERTKFLSKIPKHNETVLQYIHRLKQALRFCKFENLGLKI